MTLYSAIAESNGVVFLVTLGIIAVYFLIDAALELLLIASYRACQQRRG